MNPRIQVGTVVAPGEVVDRAQHSRVLEVDASSEPLSERLVAPWVDRTPENAVLDVRAHRLLTHHSGADRVDLARGARHADAHTA